LSQGGLEFVSRAATIDDPFFIARPAQHPPQLPGIQVMSVDILPSEIPLDSSRHFSDKLMPYLRSLVRAEAGRNLSRDDASHLEVLRRGTIIEGGKLRGPHAWLSSHLTGPSSTQTIANSNSQDVAGLNTAEHGKRKHRVLILGSGMVAKPAVDHIASRKDIELIVGECPLPISCFKLSYVLQPVSIFVKELH
jgi:alpha-aminoadipic semialdehyde synthase